MLPLEIVWVADQNALRSQYRLARVVSVNIDKKEVVRDVHIRTFPSYPVSSVNPGKKVGKVKMEQSTHIPATILQRRQADSRLASCRRAE